MKSSSVATVETQERSKLSAAGVCEVSAGHGACTTSDEPVSTGGWHSDRRLNLEEASKLPWIERHFYGLDRNGDGHVTLEELWDLQRFLAPSQR